MSDDTRYYVLRLIELGGIEFLTARGEWVNTPGNADTFPLSTATLLRDRNATGHHASAALIIDQPCVEALIVLGSRIQNGEVLA